MGSTTDLTLLRRGASQKFAFKLHTEHYAKIAVLIAQSISGNVKKNSSLKREALHTIFLIWFPIYAYLECDLNAHLVILPAAVHFALAVFLICSAGWIAPLHRLSASLPPKPRPIHTILSAVRIHH